MPLLSREIDLFLQRYEARDRARLEALEAESSKASVRACAAINVPLYGLGRVDGVALVEGDRVAAICQCDRSQVNIYEARAGDWIVAEPAWEYLDSFAVREGHAYGLTRFAQTSQQIDAGLTFCQILDSY